MSISYRVAIVLSDSALMRAKLVAFIVCRWHRLIVAVVAASRFPLIAAAAAACCWPLVDDADSVAAVAGR